MSDFNPEKPLSLPDLPHSNFLYEALNIVQKSQFAKRKIQEFNIELKKISNPYLLLSPAIISDSHVSLDLQEFRKSLQSVKIYQQTMLHGIHELQNSDGLSAGIIKSIHSRLFPEKEKGFRDGGVRIYSQDSSDIIGTAPRFDVVESHIGNILNYHESDQRSCLIKNALVHLQFLLLHPFDDGNGRVSRILSSLSLFTHDLVRFPVISLSRYVRKNKSIYNSLLDLIHRRGVEDNSSKKFRRDWVLFCLEGLISEVNFLHDKINSLLSFEQTITSTLDSHLSEDVVKAFSEVPMFTKDMIGNLFDAQDFNKVLNRCVESGLLEPRNVGSKTIYLNKRLMNILH